MWCIFLYLVHRFPFVFFKQKTAYELRISDWSSDVCSSDLALDPPVAVEDKCRNIAALPIELDARDLALDPLRPVGLRHPAQEARIKTRIELIGIIHAVFRSEEHTSELQSLMRISYAVFCLKKKTLASF